MGSWAGLGGGAHRPSGWLDIARWSRRIDLHHRVRLVWGIAPMDGGRGRFFLRRYRLILHPEAVLIRGTATGPPPPPESGGGVSSWQTEGRTAGVSAFAIAKA